MPHVVSRDGAVIGYDSRGHGPALVLVAGATQYRAVDPDLMPALADLLSGHFTVICFDRRGRGESTDVAPYAVAREVDDIAALLDAHGGSGYLFGMSSGAVLALEAAAALPGRVMGTVLYEPPIDPATSVQSYQADHAEMAAVAAQGRAADMMMQFLGGVGMPPEELAAFRQGPAWPAFEAVGLTLEHDYRILAEARAADTPPARWKEVSAPVLVLDGDASYPFMRAGADWVASGLSSAKRRTLPGQGHQFDPAVIAPVVAGFLAPG